MKTILIVLTVGAVLIFALPVVAQQSQPVLADALPNDSEMTGFKRMFRNTSATRSGQYASWGGRRDSNGLQMRMSISKYATASEESLAVQRGIDSPGGKMPEGTPSGRRIGQRAWRSVNRRVKDGPLSSSILKFLDGRCIITIYLHRKPTGRSNGVPVAPMLSNEDYRLAEDTAKARLDKLRALGLTQEQVR